VRIDPIHCKPALRQRLTRKKGCAAFTLVEMLVAAVVGAILIVLVAQMATAGLQSVGIAGGRMVSASKMHDLRAQLAADLALTPDPSLGALPGEPLLSIIPSASAWTLTLIQPDRKTSSWKRVTYHWQRDSQTLERSEGNPQSRSPGDQGGAPQTLATGLIDWGVECLAEASHSSGPQEWNSPHLLPAALLCRATLSSVREEGKRENQRAAAEKGRAYEWRIPIAGGGGLAP
jgi:prepilin-type N-terminal cleavage/methylation domain-containing protein